MKQEYTNEQLSEDYLIVGKAGGFEPASYKFQSKKISQCSVNIVDFYYGHNKSLSDLDVPGLGQKTKSVLELILEKGIKKAKEIRKNQRDTRLERSFHTTKPQPKRKLGADDADKIRYK